MSNTHRQRLLLISHHNSYRIAPYIKAAIKLGREVTIASEGQHSLVSEVANGLHIDFSDIPQAVETITMEHQRHPFAGILGSDDQTVDVAAATARVLGLPHNPPEAAQYSHRKDLARAQLAQAGCPVPSHRLFDFNKPTEKQLAGLPWPCVLKPLNMTASRGVIRADNEAEFIVAIERVRSIVATASGEFVQQHLLIEEYIDGIEIAYEGYLRHGELHTVTIFDKPDPLTGPYFEETIYVTPSGLPETLQQNIKQVLQSACRTYGLQTGVIHAECRIDSHDKVWILEIASRTIGGDCARMLDNENFGIEELAISLAIDSPIDVSMPELARGVMMIPIRKQGLLKRVEGMLEAKRVEHIDSIDVIIPQGHELVPLPEGNQYLGYIFSSAETAEQATEAIRKAHDKLDFITAPVFKIH